MTKLDETDAIGGLYTVARRAGRPLAWTTSGQQVPEDLHVADPNYLAHRSLSPRAFASEFMPDDEVVPAMIADNISEWMKKAK